MSVLRLDCSKQEHCICAASLRAFQLVPIAQSGYFQSPVDHGLFRFRRCASNLSFADVCPARARSIAVIPIAAYQMLGFTAKERCLISLVACGAFAPECAPPLREATRASVADRSRLKTSQVNELASFIYL